MFENYMIVLKKELLDIFRDKRSFAMLFVPVFLFPIMYYMMGTQLDNSKLDSDIPCIVECSTQADKELYSALFDNNNLIAKTDIVKDSYTDLKEGAVCCVVSIKDEKITVVYNQNSTKSTTAVANIQNYLTNTSMALLNESLLALELSADDIQSLNYEFLDLSEVSDYSGNAIMASIAPMMLVIVIMSSGISIAIDLFAGEKEKGTFESLLTTQVDRKSLFFAKFTAIFIIGMMSMFLSIGAYIISFMLNPKALGIYTGNMNSDAVKIQVINASQVFQVLAVCFSLSVFAVSLMSLIGLHAKTVKEAQSQMSIITILPTLLSGLTMFMESANISNFAMLIPVFNTILSIKMIFLGTVSPIQIAIASLSCIVYSFLISTVCVKILNSEKLL